MKLRKQPTTAAVSDISTLPKVPASYVLTLEKSKRSAVSRYCAEQGIAVITRTDGNNIKIVKL